MLLNKHTLETIFTKEVTQSYIYDIIKTSRKNEWALFTHTDGVVFVSWIKPYGSNNYDLVYQKDLHAKGTMITGIEITNDIFLLKKAKSKNLIIYDRKSKHSQENAITDLNEYTTEFI